MIRILIRVDRGQVELYIFLIFPGDGDMTILAESFGRERLPQHHRKVGIRPGGKHFRHQTVLIESESGEDAGSEEAGQVWVSHCGGVIRD